MNYKAILYLLLIFCFLLLPFWIYELQNIISIQSYLLTVLIGFSVLLIPLVIFHRNIKVYFLMLSIFAILLPYYFAALILYEQNDFYTITSLVFQSSFREMKEMVGSLYYFIIPIFLISLFTYLFFIYKLPVKKLSLKNSLIISLSSLILVFGGIKFKNRHDNSKNFTSELFRYYPLSIIDDVKTILVDNAIDYQSMKKFSFKAKDINPIKGKRKISIMVIGESSSYFHWGINGYDRETSPFPSNNSNLISFSNVSAGACKTMYSVPQMITRTSPNKITTRRKEKGILTAFKEADFKTFWISNQDPDKWLKQIIPHAMEADYYLFPTEKLKKKT